MTTITMRQMLEAGAHFGHQKRFWNPKMAGYIFGVRHQIHIINLEYTLPMYREALEFVRRVVTNKGRILFVGTKPAAQEIIREEAARCGMPYVDRRWLGGMLTNYKTIRQSIKRLKDLDTMRQDGSLELLTKKEGLMLLRELNKLELSLNGIKEMGGLPDVLFVIDVGHEKTAIAEAKRLGIPVIGIVDTNHSPEGIDYPIPANDDSVRAIRLYCQGLADTILEAKKMISSEMIAEVRDAGSEELEAADTTKRRVVVKKAANSKEDVSAEKAPAGDKAQKPAPVKAAAKKASTTKAAVKKPAAKKASAEADKAAE